MAREHRDRLDDDVDLAAEAAADRAADHAQLLEGDVEDQRGIVEREEQRLRVGVAGEAAVRLGDDDAAGRLDRRVLDRRGLVALLDDVVGRGEAFLDVAMAHAPKGMALIGEVVVAVILVDQRRAGLQRLLDVEDGGKLLVVDLDLGDRGARRRLRLGDHGEHRLALKAHLVDRQHRLVIGLDLDQPEDGVDVRRDVGMAENAHDARHLQRRGSIDVPDAGVMMRAAHHLQVQHAARVAVGVELGRAGDVAGDVGALLARPDRLQVVGPLGGKESSDVFHCPASSAPRRAHLRRGGEDGIDDRFVARAAADVAGDRVDDGVAIRIGIAVEQRLGGDDHAAGAEAALGGEAVGEGPLQRMEPAIGAESLDRLDGGAGQPFRRNEAGELEAAVDDARCRRRRSLARSRPWCR